MILVLWRRSPTETGFAEWQDLLLTLALFELPLTVVIAGNAAAHLEQEQMQERLAQLSDIGISPLLLDSMAAGELAALCQQAKQMVHC
jgi:hypothetical protein